MPRYPGGPIANLAVYPSVTVRTDPCRVVATRSGHLAELLSSEVQWEYPYRSPNSTVCSCAVVVTMRRFHCG